MGVNQMWWAMDDTGAGSLYGRVWTDPRELSSWVVLLDRARGSGPRGEDAPRIIFRRGSEEWASPVPPDVELSELGDDRLRGLLDRARAG